MPAWLHSNHLFRKPSLRSDSGDEEEDWQKLKPKDRATPEQANIITSVIYEDDTTKIHTPMIDLDVGHFYVKSSTRGHAHLYIKKQLTHDEYGDLLRALCKAGIIGEGTVKQFERDGCTSLRLPGLRKGIDDDSRPAGGYLPPDFEPPF